MTLSSEQKTRIEDIVGKEGILLFMKGTPQQPQCGFSAQVIQVLQRVVPDFRTFDVLSDMEIREAIKEYSDWPTIPQLYIDGEFHGGCDIVKEMYDSGELHQALGLERPSGDGVEIEIDAESEEMLRSALEQQGGEIHFGIDARFQPFLGFGPATGGEIVVEVGGLRFLMDPDTAGRANGVKIHAVDTDQGRRLNVDIPGAPQPAEVRQLTALELSALRDEGTPHRLLDVRSPEERATAEIEGSELLDETLIAELESLPKDTMLVFHCHHGARSQNAAEHFAARGFENVFNLNGGIDAWAADVDPSVPRY